MTFAAPLWLALAGGVAAVVVGLHLLARRTPRIFFLPTARFLPDRPARATLSATPPTDLLLLLVRVVMVLLIGAALARPQMPTPRGVRTIVALDRSRAAGAELDSSSAAIVRAGDVVFAFDSTATPLKEGGEAPAPGGGRGSLSVALLAAMRAAPRLAASGDSIELIFVSPFAREEWDSATLEIRQDWPGRIRLVSIGGAVPAVMDGGGVRGAAGDPVLATVALLGARLPAGVRLVRTVVTPTDSAWAVTGGTLVYWPARDSVWPPLPGPSTGVVAGNRAVVAPFSQRVIVPPGRVVARWADATPAASERTLGAGCERDVGIPVPSAGDIALRPSVQRLVLQLSGPCGGERNTDTATPTQLDSLRGTGGLLAAASVRGREERQAPASIALLLVAGALLLLEPLFRRDRVPA